MRVIVQRVSRAQVNVGNDVVGNIGRGLLVLLGIAGEDTETDADYLVDKIVGLRIFDDAGGKMSNAVGDVGGSVLVVSQFTLYGDVRRGKRPSFDAAAPPEKARTLYEYFVERIRAQACAAKPANFRKPCRWNWSTTVRSRSC